MGSLYESIVYRVFPDIDRLEIQTALLKFISMKNDKLKVKQSHYRHGQALRVPGG
jgi:hypothetical protein